MKILLLSIVSLLTTIICNAQPGFLDQEFGTNGLYSKLIPNGGDIYGCTLQSDNKLLSVGNAGLDFSIFRFTADGLPDQNFGDDGLALVHYPDLDQSVAMAVACQTGNRILVSGYGYVGYFYPDIKYTGLIVRLNDTGIIDSSFGENGIIKISDNGKGSYGSIAVQQDNSFVVLGKSGNSQFVNRFKENGEMDETFGQNGYAYLISDYSYEYNLVKIEPDGKFIIGGAYRPFSSGIRRFFLQRYLANGTVDKSFGKNGTVITMYNSYDNIIYDIGFQSDYKIIAFGLCDLTGEDDNAFATARYLVDGTLDSSFGDDGKSTIVFNNLNSLGKSLAVMPNNQLIVGGLVGNNEPLNGDYGIARLNANGSLDLTFGSNGKTITDFGMFDGIKSVFFQQNNKIVAIGESNTLEATYCSLARYNTDNSKKQIIISKIRRWLQHRNGIIWDDVPGAKNYIVQRSANGTNWSAVSNINAGSNISHINYYQDAAPLNGANYYRLQTTSITGAVAYSNVLAVTNTDVKISPNPAKNVLQIQGLQSNKIKITVIDLAGNEKMQVVANKASYNLNIAPLKAGNYLLKIEMDDEVVTKKFVKE